MDSSNVGRPPAKLGRPRKLNPKELTRSQVVALEYKHNNPDATQGEVTAAIGVSPDLIHKWLTSKRPNDLEFRRRWYILKRQQESGGPPDPGDFASWRRGYVNIQTENPYTGQLGWVGETYPYQQDFIDALSERKDRVLCLWPIRHGKTTIIEHLIVWSLCRNPDARILLVCHTLDNAKERLWKVKQILEDEEMYPDLHAKWGPWIGKADARGKPWSETRIYVRGHSGKHRSPSVRGFGVTATTYGARADLIILDDVDDPDDAPAKRDRTYRTITHTIVNRLEPGSGQLVYIGTHCGQDDVPGRLLSNPRWWTDVRNALNYDPDGTPRALCEEIYPLEHLFAAQEEFGEAFELVFQNNPNAAASAVFPPELLDNAKGAFDDAPLDWEFWTGLDPATSGRAGIVTVAFDRRSREIRVVDVELRSAPRHDGLMTMLSTQLARHKPRMVVIEAQGGSHLLTDTPEVRDLIYDGGARMVTFQTTGANKHDAQFGIPLLAREMERGRLRIANGTPEVAARMKPLLDDLRGWQPKPGKARRYDLVMALWFVVNSILTDRRPQGSRMVDPLASRPYLRARFRRLRAGV